MTTLALVIIAACLVALTWPIWLAAGILALMGAGVVVIVVITVVVVSELGIVMTLVYGGIVVGALVASEYLDDRARRNDDNG